MQVGDERRIEFTEDRLELGGGGIGIGEVVRDGVDALGGEGAHQYRAVTIGNESTPRKDFHRVGALGERFRGKGGALHDLDQIEARAQIRAHQREEIEKELRAHRCDARECSMMQQRARHRLEPGGDGIEERYPRLRNQWW